jgi:uncharacterized membrane protein YqiK
MDSSGKAEANQGELSLFPDFLLLLPVASFLVSSLIFFFFLFFIRAKQRERELVRSTPTLGKGGHRGRRGATASVNLTAAMAVA